MKYNIGDIVRDIVFNSNREFKIIDAWKNIYGEYIYLLQDLKRPEIQVKENEKFLIKEYVVI